MPSERLNGIKINLEGLSDGEVMNLLDNSLERMYRAEQDTIRVMGEASLRGLIPSDLHVDWHQMEIPMEGVDYATE